MSLNYRTPLEDAGRFRAGLRGAGGNPILAQALQRQGDIQERSAEQQFVSQQKSKRNATQKMPLSMPGFGDFFEALDTEKDRAAFHGKDFDVAMDPSAGSGRMRQPNAASAIRGLSAALPRESQNPQAEAFYDMHPDERAAYLADVSARTSEAGARARRADDSGGERDDLRAMRHQRSADYDLEYREPTRARHRAVVGDIESEAKAGRAFLPNASRLDSMNRERTERDLRTRYLDPARMDAESRVTAAELGRQGQIGAADRNLQGARGRNSATALNGLLRALETDAKGNPLNPMAAGLAQPREGEDALATFQRVLQSLVGGGDPQGGGELLDFEDAIAELMSAGFSREEAEAELRGGG